jgi:hypothetical protein
LPRKTFVASEILTASDVNEFLMDQSVMVFAGTAARGSAIPSPSEGMVTYREDDDLVEVYNGSSFVPVGGILRVVSTTKTNASTFVVNFDNISSDIPGLTASLTPASDTNKILVTVNLQVYSSNTAAGGNQATYVHLFRNGSEADYRGDAAGSRRRVAGAVPVIRTDGPPRPISFQFLDSPASTSSQTYSIRVSTNGNAGLETVYVNVNSTDSDLSRIGRYASTITLMEVAA